MLVFDIWRLSADLNLLHSLYLSFTGFPTTFHANFMDLGIKEVTRTDLPETCHLFYTMNNEYQDYLPGFMPP